MIYVAAKQLTDEVIDKLSSYYTKAVRDKHETVGSMRSAIMAS